MLEGTHPQHALTSSLLEKEGFVHAFFDRHGGVSSGPYATLNFSSASGDDREAVLRNLERAAAHLGVPASRLHLLSQVHGARVVALEPGASPDDTLRLEGDALLAGEPGVAVGVRIADCVPILLADPRSGRVSAVHAGWRGAVAGVLLRAIEALELLGTRPSELLAAVGPHLSVDAFEIGEEVAVQLEAAAPGQPVVRRLPGQKPHGDLRRLIAWQLAQAGVTQVDQIPGCTLGEPERFFSFRRDGARSGRHLAAIVAGRRP
jgi:hypothetical protein